jgi:hypothetical protein
LFSFRQEEIVLNPDKGDVTERFVMALINFLEAERHGTASMELRSTLKHARAAAEQSLTTTEYGEALFAASRAAGFEVD